MHYAQNGVCMSDPHVVNVVLGLLYHLNLLVDSFYRDLVEGRREKGKLVHIS